MIIFCWIETYEAMQLLYLSLALHGYMLGGLHIQIKIWKILLAFYPCLHQQFNDSFEKEKQGCEWEQMIQLRFELWN